MHAFLLATDGESFRDFQAHYTAIGVVYPTYYDLGADLGLEGADQPHVTRFAQQRGVEGAAARRVPGRRTASRRCSTTRRPATG